MPLLRGQIFFAEAVGEARQFGWTETHYLITAADLVQALADLAALANVRVQLLGRGVIQQYLRVSNDEVFRDSQVVSGTVPTILSNGDPNYNQRFASQPADFATSTLLVRIQAAGDLYRRSLYISGNPDIEQDIDHQSPVGAAWRQAFNRWQTVMLNGKYGFRVIDGGVGNPFRLVTSLVGGVFTTQVAHGFTVGQIVSLRRFKGTGTPRPTGRFQVATAPTATTFTLLGYDQGTFVYIGEGQVRRVVFIAVANNRIVIRRFGSHRRGRPFDQPLGRRRIPAS